MLTAAKNRPDNFDDIFPKKASFRKYLKEKFLSEPKEQLFLK